MTELSSVHCADCGKLICFSSSQPYGLLVCPECNAKREEESAAHRESEHG